MIIHTPINNFGPSNKRQLSMAEERRKILIWDFDGTLAYRQGGWTGALIDVLRQSTPPVEADPEQVGACLQAGFPWHAPENPHPGLSADEWWEDMQPVFARAMRAAGVRNGQAYQMAQDVRGVYLKPSLWQRYNDAIPALEQLNARGWTHVLLSNHTPELPQLLDQLGLRSYFAQTFNSACTGYEKPNPKAFRAVLEWAGPGAICWMIGDEFYSDILGALEIGLPGILVRRSHPDAPMYCQSLSEIVARIE
jgi:putative hydrolase of the HAD superfamily